MSTPSTHTPSNQTANPGPIIGLLAGMGAIVLCVVAFIVASGVADSVWLLAFGLVALLVGLAVLIVAMLRLMDDDDQPAPTA